MKSTFSILFFIKKNKANKLGEAPLYCRITINGQRAELSLNRAINPADWDVQSSKAKGRGAAVHQLNDYLESTRTKIYSLRTELQNKGEEVNVLKLKNLFLGIEQGQHTLVGCMNYHNTLAKEMEEKGELSNDRYLRYLNCLDKLKAFMLTKYKQGDIPLKSIDLQFITEFEHYLITKEKLKSNSANTYLKMLRKIVRAAFLNNWINVDPFLNFKLKSFQGERKYLTDGELKKIVDKKFTIERMNKIKDVFLFSCYTGIAYGDLQVLTPQDIQTNIEGQKFIARYRGKTSIPYFIPLLKPALDLIEKYKEESIITGKLMPVPSNQKMNVYLKELGDVCEIEKSLTMHMARHTFATTIALANGISMEVLMSILGHTKISTTQVYGKIMNNQVSLEMGKLDKIFENNRLKIINGQEC
jgi:integrase